MKCFELFIKENEVTKKDWLLFLDRVLRYDKDILLEIYFQFNTIEFYLYTRKDLFSLVTKFEKFVLKSVNRKDILGNERSSFNKIKVGFSTKKHVLEIKELEEIRRHRSLKRVILGFSQVLNIKIYSMTAMFYGDNGGKFISVHHFLTNPMGIFEFVFNNNSKIKKKSVPLSLKINEVSDLFTVEKKEGFLELFGFPSYSYPMYFPLQGFEFGKHSLIVGQTGTGKSKLIELFVKNLAKHSESGEYSIVIIDPHASSHLKFSNLEQKKGNFDYVCASCELFPASSEPKISTELTILLFKTLLRDQFNAKTERVLKYALYILFLKNKMSLPNLRKFLTELEFRKEILRDSAETPDHLIHFFETEFAELQTRFYEVSIMPVLVLVDELSFIPSFSSDKFDSNLDSALTNNFLTCFSLNRISLGEKATRLIAGLIIQQVFLLAQKGLVKKKIILIIDEVSTVENESLVSILSESRKFNLSLFLSQQYLTQITPDLLKGIMSNVYNYFVFKVSDDDAKILIKNMDITFDDDSLIKRRESGFSSDDIKRDFLTTLNPRELVVRVFAHNKFYSCFKGKTIDVASN